VAFRQATIVALGYASLLEAVIGKYARNRKKPLTIRFYARCVIFASAADLSIGPTGLAPVYCRAPEPLPLVGDVIADKLHERLVGIVLAGERLVGILILDPLEEDQIAELLLGVEFHERGTVDDFDLRFLIEVALVPHGGGLGVVLAFQDAFDSNVVSTSTRKSLFFALAAVRRQIGGCFGGPDQDQVGLFLQPVLAPMIHRPGGNRPPQAD
jgi:hypothetical protein